MLSTCGLAWHRVANNARRWGTKNPSNPAEPKYHSTRFAASISDDSKSLQELRSVYSTRTNYYI
eukprot:4982752-Amphidinium_carterae.1